MRESIEPDALVAKIARKHAIRREELLGAKIHGMKARNLAMWLIWESGAKSLGEIGEMFGGLDYAAVGQRIRRIRAAHIRCGDKCRSGESRGFQRGSPCQS